MNPADCGDCPPQPPTDDSPGGGEDDDDTVWLLDPDPDFTAYLHNYTPAPVHFATGHKYRTITDLQVSVPGRDLQLTRSYTSDPDYGAFGMVGERWTLSIFHFLEIDTAPATDILRYSTPSDGSVIFTYQAGSGHWKSSGPSTQYIEEAELTIGTKTYAVWRFVEPGMWQTDFYRDPEDGQGLEVPGATHYGLPLQIRDPHGNEKNFDYTLYTFSGGNDAVRLTTMTLVPNGDTSPAAKIQFIWNIDKDDPEPDALYGRLASVDVERYNGSIWIVTQKVQYTYMDEGSTDPDYDDGLGTNGDLVQVVRHLRVDTDWDTGTTDDWHITVEQYRYHNAWANNETSDAVGQGGDGDGFLEKGNEHQIKAILLPEQIEFAAQQEIVNGAPPLPASLLDFANGLLEIGDGATAFTDDDSDTYTVMNMAAKVIEEYKEFRDSDPDNYPGSVLSQYLQSACGCGGGSTQGSKLAYDYFKYTIVSDGDYGRTMKITEYTLDESGTYTDLFRLRYYDLVGFEETVDSVEYTHYYLANYAIEEDLGGGNSNFWVYHYEQNVTNRTLERVIYPSAMDTDPAKIYVPGTASVVPRYNALTSAGLVYGFAYNSALRLTEIRVSEGNATNVSDFDLVYRIKWGSAPPGTEREYLPTRIERYRTESVTSVDDTNNNNEEWMEFKYGYHTADADDVAWMETKYEAELELENGPSGSNSYFTHEFFDSKSLNVFSRVADDAFISRVLDGATGAVTTIEWNADTTNLPSHTGTTSGINWLGRNSDGDSLTATYTVDLLGRLTSTTNPSGRKTRFVYEVRELADRPDLPYYVQTVLPHTWTEASVDTFDGPASVTWFNAGNDVIGTSTYSLTGTSGTYDYGTIFSTAYDFSLDDELSRFAMQQDLSGLVNSEKSWHSIAGVGEGSGVYTTSYSYDVLGRVEEATAANGTVTANTYDVLHRVIESKVGTTSVNVVSVAQYFYDGGGSATQGVGDGNVTFVREHVNDQSGDDRDTKYSYDYRNRLEIIESPDKPHIAVEFDNLNRVIKYAVFKVVPTEVGTGADTDRGAYVEIDYSQRGRIYKQSLAVDPELAVASMTFLETNIWCDEAGRPVGFWGPNGPGVKVTYQALGRPTTIYVTDRASDDGPGAVGNYADVHNASTHKAVVTDDIVLEQIELSFVEPADYTSDAYAGLLELVTRRQRAHDATNAGDLKVLADAAATDEKVITTYLGGFYDKGDRLVRFADYGTDQTGFDFTAYNDPSLPDPDQTSPPSSSDTDQLVTEITYNVRGLTDTVKDPEQNITKTIHDDLNRTRAVVESYGDVDDTDIIWNSTDNRWKVNAGLDPLAVDVDRVTSYVYNGVHDLIKQVAHLPGVSAGEEGDVQETEYVYGVTKGAGAADSDLYSKDLLLKIIYPDIEGIEGEGDHAVFFAYNRLGERTYTKDQNGTTHEFDIDKLGRLKTDEATAFGTNIDSAIDAIGVTYDVFSRIDFVRSYSDFSTSTVANAIQAKYNKLWQLTEVVQDPTADIGAGDKSVKYTYDTQDVDNGNYSRVQTITYPDGAKIGHKYGAANSTNDLISRLHTIRDDDALQDLAIYDYIGMNIFALVDLAKPDVQLDRQVQSNGTRTAGKYAGIDTYARLLQQIWVDGNFTTGSGGNPNIPPIVEIDYTYDKRSNRLTATNDNPVLDAWSSGDFKYTYDKSYRVTEAKRGKQLISFTTGKGSQQWTLDMLGNWPSVDTDDDGNGTYDSDEEDRRDHADASDANELDQRSLIEQGTEGANLDLDLTYDKAGNLRIEDRQSRTNSVAYTYTHDAWNRLVKVVVGSDTRAVYQYNGLDWCIIKQADTDFDGTLDQQRMRYYSAGWQLCEERIDDDATFPTSPTDADIDRHVQYVAGAQYIDDYLLHREDNNTDGTYDDTYYHLTDAIFSTRAIIDDAAKLEERITYDAYGNARHHRKSDLDGDGASGAADNLIILANWGNFGKGDLDRSGTVGSADLLIQSNDAGGALAVGEITFASSVDNQIGFSGHVFNAEVRMYTMRMRCYLPKLGRFIERDPAGYVDGMNLYEYVRGNPLNGMDPYGLTPAQWFRYAPPGFLEWIVNDPIEPVHIVLDLLGLLPYYGEPFDGINAVIYGFEGEWGNAGFSTVAMVPVGGWGATLAKRLRQLIPWNKFGGAVWGWLGGKWKIIHDFFMRKGGGKRGCFVAGTLVLSASGPVPIEEVQAGDEVWSYNIETQVWELCEVIERQVREYDGLILRLTIATEDGSTETIECTDEHPFWVTAGENLSQRPAAEAVPSHEREMTVATHGGRWTGARWLRIGDHFLTRAGKSATVSGLTIRIERVKVYNLNVKDLHLYAVGSAGVLVHNKTLPKAVTRPGFREGNLGGWHPGVMKDGKYYVDYHHQAADSLAGGADKSGWIWLDEGGNVGACRWD